MYSKKLSYLLLISIFFSKNYCGEKLSKEEQATLELIEAVKNSDIDAVRKTLAQGADVKAYSVDGLQPLMIAAEKGLDKIAELLIIHGAPVNAGAEKLLNGKTPLMFAATSGTPKTIDILIKNGANINKQIRDGRSAIFYAIANGKKDVVDELLKNNADINNTIGVDKTSPLQYAIEVGEKDIANRLIAKGANLEHTNQLGETALMIAIRTEHIDIASDLVRKHPTINVNTISMAQSPLDVVKEKMQQLPVKSQEYSQYEKFANQLQSKGAGETIKVPKSMAQYGFPTESDVPSPGSSTGSLPSIQSYAGYESAPDIIPQQTYQSTPSTIGTTEEAPLTELKVSAEEYSQLSSEKPSEVQAQQRPTTRERSKTLKKRITKVFAP